MKCNSFRLATCEQADNCEIDFSKKHYQNLGNPEEESELQIRIQNQIQRHLLLFLNYFVINLGKIILSNTFK